MEGNKLMKFELLTT